MYIYIYHGYSMDISWTSPFELSQSVGVSIFFSDKSRDVDPFLETDLYRIEGTKLILKMAISKKLLAPSHSLNVHFWPWGGLVGLL